MLRKKTNGVAKGPRAGSLLSSLAAKTMDRRGFLAASGVTVGGLAALSLTSGRVEAATPSTEGGKIVRKKLGAALLQTLPSAFPAARLISSNPFRESMTNNHP